MASSKTQGNKLFVHIWGEYGVIFLSAIFIFFFFVSGACGLVYEVVWMRYLSLFFGSDIYSSSITLAAFMGGLALGGYLASRVVDKIQKPLVVYAFLELLIGAYAFLFSGILGFFDPVIGYVYLKYFQTSPLVYHAARITIAFFVVAVPTAMMGATLPILLKVFTRDPKAFGETAARFYAANTFGALTGVLVSGFILMPVWGLRSTNQIAVVTNLLIAAACFFAIKFFNSREECKSYRREPVSPRGDGGVGESLRKAVLVAVFISGFGSFALEVIWTRILILSFSGTVYSFSIMLVSTLFGMALGSKFVARRIGSAEKAVRILAKLEIVAAVSIAILACLSLFIPRLFHAFVWGISMISSRFFGLGSVLGSLAISAIFILPSAALLGAAFPAALRAYNENMENTGRHCGRIVFVNTLGCVLGALAAGFLMLPLVGARASLFLLSVLFFANGIYVRFRIGNGRLGNAVRRASLAAVLLAAFIATGFFIPQRPILNYGLHRGLDLHSVYHNEGISGEIDILKSKSGATVLSIDGNVEADDSLKQRRHFILKAQLPLMLSAGPKEILVIGLGMGITVGSLLRDDEVSKVDVVELLPGVVKAQKYLKTINRDVLSDPRLRLRIDDGRNFLRFTDKLYDIITADPVHPRISGVGVLYTREYYQLLRDHLKKNGVALQWMPLYSLSPRSFEVAVRTMFEVFPNTTVWYVPGHILLLGAKDKDPVFDYRIVSEKFSNKNVASDLASIGIRDIVSLFKTQIMSSKDLGRFLHRAQKTVNTEDRPYLEYRTPFEFLWTPQENLKAILPYAGSDSWVLSHAPQDIGEELALAQKQYQASILSSFSLREK